MPLSRRDDTIPVTILSGSLGAGKTTLLNHLLRNAGDRDLAVLVNDVGELNVDADLVSEQSELAVGDGVTELSNGCICCELQDDLNAAVVRLAQNREFDALVVEASGISEPGPIARLFTTGSRAAALYRVDAVVTVVDARLFFDTFGGDRVPEKRGTGADDTRPLSDLLVEQVELADVVVLNKCDLVTDAERERVEELLAALRPDAEIVATTESEVPPDRVLDRGLYDPATAAEAAGWRQALERDAAERESGESGHEAGHSGHEDHNHGHDHGHDHADPEAVYGVTSFVYRARRPFHPGRIAAFLSDLPAGVVRSKGTLWVAGREETMLAMGQAGPSVRVEGIGRWVASLPEFEQDAYRRNRRNLEWDDEWGDRRTELVFIGTDFDEAAIRDALDGCLLTDAEFDGDWDAFENDFPDAPEVELVLASP